MLTLSNPSPQTFHILPYTKVVGQDDLKLALELTYVAPRIGGVLISGQRGTAKSTVVRAFAQMVYGSLPTTLPINATEDRIVGGWNVQELLKGEAKRQPGLLEDADGKMLYIDEVNLLEDHLANIILDVSSTGVLVIEREGWPEQKSLSFVLVGTMNPEEGSLRPQLLDRFGLMVTVKAERDLQVRSQILQTVLQFDNEQANGASSFIAEARAADANHKLLLDRARDLAKTLPLPSLALQRCVALAEALGLEGHRGEHAMALAAGAHAALAAIKQNKLETVIMEEDVNRVARFAVQHRRLAAWDAVKDGAILRMPTTELRDGR